MVEQLEEPLLSPEAAREWVLNHQRITEVDGKLVTNGHIPHVGLAGVEIASGTEPRKLSEVYRELSGHRGQISDKAIADIARTVVASYHTEEEPEVLTET